MAIERKKYNWSSRDKKKMRLRKKIRGTDQRPRVCVFRSEKHIYAQLISDTSGVTLASASTRDADLVAKFGSVTDIGECNDSRSSKSISAAGAVGKAIAEKAAEKGITSVVFDRNGYLYHGRIKAVAEGARSAGLVF
jgi:large subunit ribosomal protein L18